MLEAYSVRVLDALDSDAAQVQVHDGRRLIGSAHSTAVSAASWPPLRARTRAVCGPSEGAQRRPKTTNDDRPSGRARRFRP